MNIAKSSACLALIVVFATACSSEDEGPDVRLAIVQSTWSDFFEPELVALTESTASLETDALAYCSSPDPAGLESLRTTWEDSHRHLKRQEVFSFGPYTEEPERFQADLDFWPQRPDQIEEVVSGDIPLTDATVSSFTATTRGLPVAEYLLWNEPNVSAEPRRCTYLVAVAGAANSSAESLYQAWDPQRDGFFAELLNPGDGFYGSSVASLSEVVNRLWFMLENIRRDYLGRPVGSGAGTPQPELVEAPYAARSLEAVSDRLDALESIYFGSNGESGIAGLVAESDAELNDRVATQLADARAAIANVELPLAEAVVSENTAVQAIIDELGELQTTIEVDVISELGLSRSFNDADGD